MNLAVAAPWEVPPTGAVAVLALRLAALVPVLTTARTALRAPLLSDFPAWAEILCSDRATLMDGPYSREAALTEFSASVGGWLLCGHGVWTVTDLAGGEVLGFVSVHLEPSDREPELGFFLRAAAEGRGLAHEAASVARDWAWAQGLTSLVSYVDPANPRSSALARRLGAARDPVAEAAFDGTADAGVAVWRHPGPEARA